MPESSTKSGIYLEISSQIWSAWDLNKEFEVVCEQYEIEEGSEIVHGDGQFSIHATVTSVSAEEIHVTLSDSLLLVDGDGTYNLLDTQTDISVSYGETVELATPTMDAGCVYKLTYVMNAGE